MTSEQIWLICKTFVDDGLNARFAKARGTCAAEVILKLDLAFDPDGKPHQCHANVIGWPSLHSKDKIKNIQQKIAAAMTAEARPMAARP